MNTANQTRLQDIDNLMLYVEEQNSDLPTTTLVALFESKYVTAMNSTGGLRRFFKPPRRHEDIREDATCLAAANISIQAKGPLLVENIAAVQGFGPTMYAALLELARAVDCTGVLPSSDPGAILQKPKDIWKNFATNYGIDIVLTPVHGKHIEPCLNNIFSIAQGSALLDIEGLRKRYRDYLRVPAKYPVEKSLRLMAFDMAQLSVEAHRKLKS